MGDGKLRDIKETASDAVEILRQLRTQEVRESLDKAREISATVKDIVETMKTPEWVQNIENVRKLAEEMKSSSASMDSNIKAMRENGAFDDLKGLVKSTKNVMDALGKEDGGIKARDLQELSVAFKETLQSLKVLMDELTVVAAESKRSGTLRNTRDAATSLSNAYKTATDSS